MKVTGVLFWVQENQTSEKFYKKLGFSVNESDETHSVVSLNSFDITLLNMRDEDRFAKDSLFTDKGRGMYVYIKVDDVDSKYNELKDSGITSMTEPKDWEWGNREFIVKDPDGYKLCFWKSL
jgi:uncharacterized glyoxalase superfamily protein PhnB